MAKPDSSRNSRALPSRDWSWPCEPATNTMTQASIRTTMVRIAVATVESVCRMPHFASMAVTPAKKAEPAAKRSHISSHLVPDMSDRLWRKTA